MFGSGEELTVGLGCVCVGHCHCRDRYLGGTRELWKVMREALLTTPPPAHSTQQGRGAAAILTPFVEKLASWDVLGGLPSVLPCGGRVGWREGELGV